MAEYVGLKRIAERMGYRSANSAAALLCRDGFPMYRRYRSGKLCWVTNDGLIKDWELSRVQAERDRVIGQDLYRHARGSASLRAKQGTTAEALASASWNDSHPAPRKRRSAA